MDRSGMHEDWGYSYLWFPSMFPPPPSLLFWKQNQPFGHKGGLRPTWNNRVLPGAWGMTLKETYSLSLRVVNLRLPMASFPATWKEYLERSPETSILNSGASSPKSFHPVRYHHYPSLHISQCIPVLLKQASTGFLFCGINTIQGILNLCFELSL